MNINVIIGQATKADVVVSAIMVVSIVAFIAAAELSAPIIAGLGATGAAASAIYRVATATKKT